jgi:hypothetical protein
MQVWCFATANCTLLQLRRVNPVAESAIVLRFIGPTCDVWNTTSSLEQRTCFCQAAAARGKRTENGLWCSKARSRWPMIVYFGLWVGGIMLAISLRN